jgi:hypothetical protein
LYFSEVSIIFYVFYNLALFSGIYLIISEKEKRIGKPLLANGPKAAHDMLPRLSPRPEIGPWS